MLADRVVTQQEARELEQIRASLGVSDEDWERGQKQIGASRVDALISHRVPRHG